MKIEKIEIAPEGYRITIVISAEETERPGSWMNQSVSYVLRHQNAEEILEAAATKIRLDRAAREKRLAEGVSP